MPGNHARMLWFSGLRGAMAFALALEAAATRGDDGRAILTGVLGAVVFTTLVVGGLTPRALAWLGISTREESAREGGRWGSVQTSVGQLSRSGARLWVGVVVAGAASGRIVPLGAAIDRDARPGRKCSDDSTIVRGRDASDLVTSTQSRATRSSTLSTDVRTTTTPRRGEDDRAEDAGEDGAAVGGRGRTPWARPAAEPERRTRAGAPPRTLAARKIPAHVCSPPGLASERSRQPRRTWTTWNTRGRSNVSLSTSPRSVHPVVSGCRRGWRRCDGRLRGHVRNEKRHRSSTAPRTLSGCTWPRRRRDSGHLFLRDVVASETE